MEISFGAVFLTNNEKLITMLVKFCTRASRFLRRNIKNSYEKIYQAVQYKYYHLTTSPKKSASYQDILKFDSRDSGSHISLTLTLPVRYFHVKNIYFERYLETLLDKSYDLSSIELLVWVDEDDNLKWFSDLKVKYAGILRMIFFIGPQRGGYQSTNYFHAELIKNKSCDSRIWVMQASDCSIEISNWDKILLEIVARSAKNYFICTDASLEESISIKGPNPIVPKPVYWIRGALWPIVSTNLLDDLLSAVPPDREWTILGKSFNMDGYFGDLLRHLYQQHRLNIHIQVPEFFKEYNPVGWKGVKSREDLRTRTLLELFSFSTQAVHKYLAYILAKKINND